MKQILYSAIIALAACNANNAQTEFQYIENDSTAVAPEDPKQEEDLPTTWRYEENEDKMTGKKSLTAFVVSSNTEFFDFPYDGGSRFIFGVRKGKFNDLYVATTKGQFSGSYNRKIKMRFDDEPAMVLNFGEASDGSSDVIYPDISRNKVIAKLKKSKRLLIEATFHQQGLVIMEFNVEGFNWE